MTTPQNIIILILLVTIGMFLWGRWRHDIIALAALLACVLGGVLDPAIAFNGFGHPAVVTVACVLVLSAGLQRTGAVDVLARYAMPNNSGLMVSMAALIGVGALLSGFMNNVGALALLMPVALQVAKRFEVPPGRILMPLAFGTILGGMTTMIGTPPNLIVAGFSAQQEGARFSMFDFTPVGLAVALAGGVFVLLAWRLVPVRKPAGTEGFETGAYLTEARVTKESKIVDKRLCDIENEFDESGAQIVGLIRNDVKISAPSSGRIIQEGDILVLEAEVDSLGTVLSALGLELVGTVKEDKSAKTEQAQSEQSTSEEAATNDAAEKKAKESKPKNSEHIVLMELVVRPESILQGRSATNIMLRSRYSLNLLAVSRDGDRSKSRIRNMIIKAGDLLLLQGTTDSVLEFASDYGCVPLAKRELKIPDMKQAFLAATIMFAAVAGAALGLLPAEISFALGVLASMVFRTLPPQSVYSAIDWPVIVLLAALIPVAGVMEATGAAELIASLLMEYIAQGNAVVALAMVLIITMFLSDLMNNAATAAVMCPIAIGAAMTLGVNTSSFLMAVAIGASCAFLTPIGHQNNTLILGPGGFKFSDYWRLGLPLEILVVAVALPLLLVFWPL